MSLLPFSRRLSLLWACVFVLGLGAGIYVYRAEQTHWKTQASKTAGGGTVDPRRDAIPPTWTQRVDSGFHAALYTWLVLGLPLVVVTLRSRHSRRDELILKLSHAVEQSRSGILIVSPTGVVEFVNEGLCSQIGWAADELTGRHCSEFRHARLPAESLDALLVEVRAGRSAEIEWENRHKDGRTYPAQAVVTPVHGARGAHLGYIAVISDLTQHQLQQEELKAAKDLAEAGDRAKGAFLATMSHEVRTPLNGIVGFTNLLLETPLTVEQREYVQTIRTSGEALVQLTGDILDFTRIESGGLELDVAVCDVRATVEDALDIFAAKAAEKGIELLHGAESDVPSQVILDAGRLRQVLVNLVGNGIKFTGEGHVEVTTRVLSGKGSSIAPFDLTGMGGQMVAELEEDGSLVLEFSVRDTGIGIAAEDRARLFRPFTQLDVSTVRRYGGAGLGLAISRNLVRLMDGDIWIESEVGKGSAFTFTVRARTAPPADLTAVSRPSLLGCRVGVVSTQERLQAELIRVLQGYGAEALAVSPDLSGSGNLHFILVDCMDSFIERLDTWTSQPQWNPTRSFGLVNVTHSSLDRQVLRPHFRMLLNKPVHHRTLADIVARAFVKEEGRSAHAGS